MISKRFSISKKNTIKLFYEKMISNYFPVISKAEQKLNDTSSSESSDFEDVLNPGFN